MIKFFLNNIYFLVLSFLLIIIALYFFNIFKPKSIEGIIIFNTDNTFSIITSNDTIYTLNKNSEYEYKNGEIVKITYNKSIDDKKNIQNINILNVIKLQKLSFNKEDLYYDYYDSAIETIDNMSLEEKIGQLLISRVPLTDEKDAINRYHLGGYLLFERDVRHKSSEELAAQISNYQSAARIPLLIAIDEEGGTVSRLSGNTKIVSSPFLSPQELYKTGGFKAIEDDTINKSKLLFSLGINVNLAPIADTTTNKNSYMFSRSFGKNEILTAKYIETVIKNSDEKVSYVLKHFPGYGENIDTHTNIAIDKKSYRKFLKKDFKPFSAGINNYAQAILFSHNYITSMDSHNPSSLSPNIHNILRNTLHFSGVTITDDLEMKSIKNIKNKYTSALLAGNNLLIVSNYKEAYIEILDNVKSNYISEELINRLLVKTISWKYYKKLI